MLCYKPAQPRLYHSTTFNPTFQQRRPQRDDRAALVVCIEIIYFPSYPKGYYANQNLIGCWNNDLFCSVGGKFEYQKKCNVDVSKQEISLYVSTALIIFAFW